MPEIIKENGSLYSIRKLYKDSDDEMSEFLNIDDKENSLEISLSKPKPGLFDIKNRKLNKHQDFSLFMLI